MYRIHQIKLKLNEPKSEIPKKIIKKIGGKNMLIDEWQIVKESLDCRKKDDIKWVYSIDFSVVDAKNKKKHIKLKTSNKISLEAVSKSEFKLPWVDPNKDMVRPIVCGFGPAGIFCALVLAKVGLNPIVIERGEEVQKRASSVEKFWQLAGKGSTNCEANEEELSEKAGDIQILNPDSNVQFGEGGAGTFSDGKLTTGIKDPRIRYVLEQFVEHGGDKSLLYKQKPHVGTDVLQSVVRGLREEILSLGGDVYFNTKLVDIEIDRAVKKRGNLDQDFGHNFSGTKCIKAITICDTKTGKEQRVKTDCLVLAIGHSARDTFRMLKNKGLEMSQKPFSMGIRIQHPQDLIDIAQYGRTSKELGLPVADYKLSHKCQDGRGVYTFCMCPGGEIINASSCEEMVATNGMSNSKRDSGFANSGVLCDIVPEDFESDDPLAGVSFQEKYERLAFINGGANYALPRSTYGEINDAFSQNKKNPVKDSLPEFVIKDILEAIPEFAKKIDGFDRKDSLCIGIESRSSSPVRFARGENGESTIGGIYPCGEGAGYAGGIMSSACDGIKIAEKIIEKLKNN